MNVKVCLAKRVECSILERAVNPGRRFTPAEEQESLYATNVKLTIKNIKKSDFGNYTCHARNSLGNIRGNIALRGGFKNI